VEQGGGALKGSRKTKIISIMYQKSSHLFRTLAFMVALSVWAIGAGVAAPLKVAG